MTATNTTPTYTIPAVNAQGFVEFKSRNWKHTGSRNTWARWDEDANTLTINIAKRGGVNTEYWDELQVLCEDWGVEWIKVSRGDRLAIKRPDNA